MRWRQKTIIATTALTIALLGGMWILFHRREVLLPFLSEPTWRARLAESEHAFAESDGNPAMDRQTHVRTDCAVCHTNGPMTGQAASILLKTRSDFPRQAWAEAIPLSAKCGVCHLVPPPSALRRGSWVEVVSNMQRIMELRRIPPLTPVERADVLHYYYTFSPEELPALPEDPDPAASPLKFQARALGMAKSPDSREHPAVGHVQILDLDNDGHLDVLTCDSGKSQVTWIHQRDGAWQEELLAAAPRPAHAQVVTNAIRGGFDIVVACQGVMAPTDDLVGSVVLLSNDGQGRFSPSTILQGISRVADVEPGDFDGDGDVDFVVGAYGFIQEGEIGWLENEAGARYRYHLIQKRSGAIHVLPTDLNHDGRLDFVALFAQEHEMVSAFLNTGEGAFEERLLFQAATPTFGSSGIQLVDLDQDGDVDILYTNGDNMDLPTRLPRPYHGVQWLENKGHLNFEWHDLCRFYGAYCAVAADLNNDGRPDIVVSSMFNDWSDPARASLIWLENVGRQQFTPHAIAREPNHLISVAVADLNGDGWADIVASGLHLFPPYDRMGRVTLWENQPRR